MLQGSTTIHHEHTQIINNIHSTTLTFGFPNDRMSLLMHTALLAITVTLSLGVGYRLGHRAAYSDLLDNLAKGQQALLNTTTDTFNYVKTFEEKFSQFQETSRQLNHCKENLHKTQQTMNRCWICPSH